MTDPETVKYIEESVEMKFVPIEVYDSMTAEMAHNEDVLVKKKEEELAKKTEEEKVALQELEGLSVEHEGLKEKAYKAVGLDQYCGECKWNGGTSCDARVSYLMDKYLDTQFYARAALLKQGLCKKG